MRRKWNEARTATVVSGGKLIVHGALVTGDLDITKHRARGVHDWYFDPRLFHR